MTKTKILKINPASPDESAIEFAATLLKDGGLVAFPTETVYGIGANFLNAGTVRRLYEVKKRPLTKPFTVHISSVDTVREMGCVIPPLAERFIKEYWPGPLTLVLKSKKGKLGFRMPKCRIAKDFISKSGVPVVAPSANLSGRTPPREAAEVLKDFDGKIDLILDGGPAEMGVESTVVDMTAFPYKILREGAVLKNELDRIAANI